MLNKNILNKKLYSSIFCLFLASTVCAHDQTEPEYADGLNLSVYTVENTKKLDVLPEKALDTLKLEKIPFKLNIHAQEREAVKETIAYKLDGFYDAQEPGTHKFELEYQVNVPTDGDSVCYTNLTINNKELIRKFTWFSQRETVTKRESGKIKLDTGLYATAIVISCTGISDYSQITTKINAIKPSTKVTDDFTAKPGDFKYKVQ